MKWKLLALLGLVWVSNSLATEPNKLYVHEEYDVHANMVLFIQDLETGTRCYAITNSRINTSGYAISCVPKQ